MANQTLEDYLDEVFGEKSAEPAFQTVVLNILEEPIEEQHYQFFEEQQVEEQRGKIITKWRFYTYLERPITPEIMRKLDKTEKIHKIRFNYMYQLRNIENDEWVAYFKESERSPWFDNLSETEDWVAQEEE